MVRLVSVTLNDEDHVSFDSKNSVISNLGTNPITITINDEDVVLLPGESISLFTPADHYLGYPAKTEIKRDHEDNDDDKYSKYEKYLKYFKEHHHDKYSKFAKYLKYFKDNHSEKHEKYFKYAKYC